MVSLRKTPSQSCCVASNLWARKFGVRSAMPGFIARKLCPELILVPTDFKKYTHYSDLTRKAELAEMLSTDMHKEGLDGRTLTLKLKTASFEDLVVGYMGMPKYSGISMTQHPKYITLSDRNERGREMLSLI